MFDTKRSIAAIFLLVIFCFGVFCVPVVQAQQQTSAPSSDLVNLTGSSGPVLAAVASCGLGVGMYYLIMVLKALFSDSLSPSPLVTLSPGSNSDTAGSQLATQELDFKQKCTVPIEKAVGQTLIKYMTQKTVAWINNGFSESGGSIFPKDSQSLFKDLQDAAVGDFIGKIGFNSKDFPFGKSFAQRVINAQAKQATDNVKFDLDQVIKTRSANKTASDFGMDWRVGGWSGFNSSMQNNNNPVGFEIEASKKLSQIVATVAIPPKAAQIASQLNQNQGFLNVTTCKAPDTITSDSIAKAKQAQSDMKDAIAAYAAQSDTSSGSAITDYGVDGDPNAGGMASDNGGTGGGGGTIITPEAEKAIIDGYQTIIKAGTCTKTETTTPGHIAAAQLDKALGSPLDQLGLSSDLNASLTLIFDSAINQLVKEGLSSMTDSPGSTGSSSSSGGSTVTTTGSAGTSAVSQQWYDANPNFTFDVDTLNTLIDNEQKVADVDTQKISLLNGLRSAATELDLCIPGPRPNWDLEVKKRVAQFISQNLPKPVCTSFTQNNIWGVSTTKDDNGPCRPLYNITGIMAMADPISDSKTFGDKLTILSQRYIDRVKATYPDGNPPEQYQAKQFYLKITVYTNDINDATDDQAKASGNVNSLKILKSQLSTLIATNPSDIDKKKAALKTIFDRNTPNLHLLTDLDSKNAEYASLQDDWKTIMDPGDGLVDQCIKDTTDPLYSKPVSEGGYGLPISRRPYDPNLIQSSWLDDPTKAVLKNIPPYIPPTADAPQPSNVSFLPGVYFGDGKNGTIKIDDLYKPYQPSSSGITDDQGNWEGYLLSGGFWGFFEWQNGGTMPAGSTTHGPDVSVFENFLNMY